MDRGIRKDIMRERNCATGGVRVNEGRVRIGNRCWGEVGVGSGVGGLLLVRGEVHKDILLCEIKHINNETMHIHHRHDTSKPEMSIY